MKARKTSNSRSARVNDRGKRPASFDVPTDEKKKLPSRDVDELLHPTVLERQGFGNLVALCGEPGMGKTYVARRLMEMAEKSGRTAVYFSLLGSGEQASKRVVRRCRELRMRLGGDGWPLVVIDDLPPADEAEALYEGRAVTRLVDAGVQVVLCLRPEAEQILEQFEVVSRYTAVDLLFRGEEDSRAYDLTAGIPALVMAHRVDVNTGTELGESGPRYLRALWELLDSTLRSNLAHEEFKVRLALVLLGHATLDELDLVAGRCDTELLFWLERDVPLLGVDSRAGACSCHGLCKDEVLEGCLGVLQGIAATEPELVVRACGVLASRGNARRSALVCRLCASEQDFARVCVMWGVSYVSIGEAEIVDEALRVVGHEDVALASRYTFSRASLKCVAGTAHEADEALAELDAIAISSSTDERLHHAVELLGACRDTLRNPRQASKYLSIKAYDQLGLACLEHVRCAHLLAAGRFSEAYSTLSGAMRQVDGMSVPEACLCDDLALALAFCGGIPDAKEQRLIERSGHVFARPGLRKLRSYHEAVLAVPAIVMGDGVDAQALVDAVGRAEHAGDSFFLALCLTVAAIADVRTHALSRAHVRAARAASIAIALGETYLASSAELIDALSLELLGEPNVMSNYCSTENRPSELALIGTLVARAVSDAPSEPLHTELPEGTPCPRDSLWVLNLLASGCPDIWEALVGIIPPTWVELLRAIRNRKSRSAGVLQDVPALRAPLEGSPALSVGRQGELLPPDRGARRIHISVLGGFRVECDGKLVPESAFDRRRARDLIALLSVVPGHRLRRYQAIEALWPKEDYFKGPRKLYEATGEARKRLSEACSGGVKAIVADKTQGSVGFDVSLVSFDVDEFEVEARMALSEDGDDFWVLEHARRMERMYASGPNERLAALGESVAQRLRELRTLYVDGTVAAGEAALRLGKAKLAVRYATDAHRMDELREDAMILLVRALRAAGRNFEIAELYRRYSRLLIDAQGTPPSLALRRAVEQALGGGPDAFPS